jgi:4-hydroxythreonine-4-phosphate dehydrogenase
LPRVVISIGDINGIGPEIVVKALAKYAFNDRVKFFLVSPGKLINDIKTNLKLELPPNCSILEPAEITTQIELQYGKPTQASGEVAYKSLIRAIEMCKNKEADALVTAPLSKNALHQAGYIFNGHTEILQEVFVSNHAQMLFVAESVKLLLLTRHIPLKAVSSIISQELIIENIQYLVDNLKKDFSISTPSVAVCGLNPHAGESGSISDEEEVIIKPAIEYLISQGLNITGPYPSDSFWRKANTFDCCVALYHDQGLIPLKLLYPDNLVNVTTGLPIIRTSPCHGTAYDIAGQFIAQESSMIQAIQLACKIAQNRNA